MRPVKTITIQQIRALLAKQLGVVVTRAPIYQWMKTKGFPKPLSIGRPCRWREDEVEEWVEIYGERKKPSDKKKSKK